MNRVVLLNLIGGAWALVLGSTLPLAVLYVMRWIQRSKLSGWKFAGKLVLRILLTILAWAFVFMLAIAGFGWMLTGIEGLDEELSGLTFFGAFFGSLFGGFWFLVAGYRKGRRVAKIKQATASQSISSGAR